MAEGKKKINKKWIIALAILVLIAVVVVLVIVLLPKNTKGAVDKVQTQSEEMFLKDKTESSMFDEMQRKINNSATDYIGEVASAKTVLIMLNDIMDFYNDYMVFAKDNKTFQNNYNVIMDSFGDANQYQKDMNAICLEVHNKVENSSTFIKGAWTDFKVVYAKYIKSYSKAIKGLNKVFTDCVPKGIINNDYTVKVLTTIDDYLNVINTGFETKAKVIEFADTFTKSYLKSEELAKYKFSKNLQEKLASINKFSQLYGKTLQDVIATVDKDGIHMTPSETDKDGKVLDDVKLFLLGGVRA